MSMCLGIGLWGCRGGGGESAPRTFWDFSSGAQGFDGGTHSTGNGYDYRSGYMTVAVGDTGTATLEEAVDSGKCRVDFSVNITDAETASGGSKNTTIMALPASGAVSSANSLAAITLNRDTAQGAGPISLRLQYRSGGSFSNESAYPRTGWIKFSMVIDFATNTWDLLVDDMLRERALSWPNASAADLTRIVVSQNASSPTCNIDDIRVTAPWDYDTDESELITDDFTVGSGAIEDSKPDTDGYNNAIQFWDAPTNTSKGSFTRGATGLTPDSSKTCSAFYRTGHDGVWECEFTASGVTNDIHGGIAIRAWGGEDGALNEVLFRFWDGSSNDIALFSSANGSSVTVLAQSASLAGTSISTGADYTMRIEARGRYFWCYVNDQLQFGGPVKMTAARGITQEGWAGPIIDTTLGDTANRCKSFSYTGKAPSRVTKTVGDLTAVIEPGAVQELYHASHPDPDSTLFQQRGLQMGHGAANDTQPGAYLRTRYSTANLLVLDFRGLMFGEASIGARSDCTVVMTRDGFWSWESVYYNVNGINYAPDLDLRPRHWSLTYRYIQATGSSTETTKSFGDFASNHSNSAFPLGFQALTSDSGTKVRLTSAMKLTNGTSDNGHTATKHEGFADPISHAFTIPGTGILAGQTKAGARRLLFDAGSLSLSDSLLTAVRDEVKNPPGFSVSVGSIKTDADGDADADGFNERLGWGEITASSGAATFTVLGATHDRHQPKFRIHGGSTSGTISGLTIDVDYVRDDLGDGSVFVQILSTVTSDTAYVYS